MLGTCPTGTVLMPKGWRTSWCGPWSLFIEEQGPGEVGGRWRVRRAQMHLTGDKRHISAIVGSQIVIVAPRFALHVYAYVVSSCRSETAPIAWR